MYYKADGCAGSFIICNHTFRQLKAKRKQEQDENVEAKKKKKEEHKKKCLEGMGLKSETKEKGEPDAAEDVEDDDDAQYYREEVGEEPDPGRYLCPSIVNISYNVR